ncbi:MAG: PilX N-terminal domain-containing pilus assembly protein [Candidatus Marithrix sp.]
MKTNFYKMQEGAVLLMSLVLLIILTLLGITALDSTKLETRMAANLKEDHTAFQAANAGLDQAYHNYVYQGKHNNYADLKDFPEEGEWSEKEPVVLKGSDPGLKFDNHAAASLRIKKVTVPETSQFFYIIESTGSTNCSDGSCDGHNVTLVEGWSFKGAKDNGEHSDELKKCLKFSTSGCQNYFAGINACAANPNCTIGIVPLTCGDAPAGAKPIPEYCITIFENIVDGLSI